MYVAMNRFSVNHLRELEFEQAWKNRKSYLDQVKGFQQFKMLKGQVNGDVREYISETNWDSQQDFKNWTQSEQFKAAHKNKTTPPGVLTGHPKFEGFEVIISKLD